MDENGNGSEAPGAPVKERKASSRRRGAARTIDTRPAKRRSDRLRLAAAGHELRVLGAISSLRRLIGAIEEMDQAAEPRAAELSAHLSEAMEGFGALAEVLDALASDRSRRL